MGGGPLSGHSVRAWQKGMGCSGQVTQHHCHMKGTLGLSQWELCPLRGGRAEGQPRLPGETLGTDLPPVWGQAQDGAASSPWETLLSVAGLTRCGHNRPRTGASDGVRP